ncbi:MAG: DUF3995 domain-containing protein [Thermoleophilaceae bacterium]|nr:DUF3995 domain-containing protein [Thermoleophilaceae bacterium]
MTHRLECRVEPKMVVLYPILIRQHDALVEDLLDRAELATTGRIARPSRWPLSVRIANSAELRVARWRGKLPPPDPASGALVGRHARVAAIAVPAVMLAIAALHAAWALGSPWPAGSEPELAEHVLSQGERQQLDGGLPPAPVTWAVALALLAAAAIVRAAATGPRSRALRRAAWGVAAVFVARGVVYIPSDLIGGLDDAYQRFDLAIYSPLCLALGAGTAVVARRASAASRLMPAGPTDRAASPVISQGHGP